MIQSLAILLIRIYQKIVKPILDQILLSVFGFKSVCKSSPSCSEYTVRVIQKHGFIRGIKLGVRRIGQCHSFH